MTRDEDKIPDDIEALSFEDALKALEGIVNELESGSVSLENSIDIYTRGTHLKRHCEEKLKNAQARIEKISVDGAGSVKGVEPFDPE